MKKTKFLFDVPVTKDWLFYVFLRLPKSYAVKSSAVFFQRAKRKSIGISTFV